jgi:hypothetical protein
VIVAGTATPAAAEGPCPTPHATLDGDPAAVASVSAELIKLGVTVGAPVATCQVIATVETDPNGIAVAVKTGAQSEGRTVSDPAIAATWIDSWLQDDFGGPRFTTQLAAAPIANTIVEARVEPPPSRAIGIQISAAFDQAWTFDGSRWNGFSAGACAQLGAWCFGARGRYAMQDELVAQTAASRSDLSVLATASREQQFGRLKIVPELGLGVGRMATSRIDGCRPPPTCDPRDTQCMNPQASPECVEHDPEHAYTLDLNDHLKASTVTPRASASVRVAIALADQLWLDGSAAVMLSPFDHGNRYAPPSGTQLPPGVSAEQIALPGESIGTFELGIGLRWGTR